MEAGDELSAVGLRRGMYIPPLSSHATSVLGEEGNGVKGAPEMFKEKRLW